MADIAAEIFRAYDIRGRAGDSLTPAAVARIGRAFAAAARARGLAATVVGRDGRLSSPELSQALVEGLRQGGLEVIDIGAAPTPLAYYAAERLDTGTAVIVTGSHNPPQDNGLKFVLAGEALHGEAIQRLHRHIRNEVDTPASEPGRYQQHDIQPDYLARISHDIRIRRPLRVAIDCGNGIAGAVAPPLLRRLGLEPVELYCEVDGRFPNHHPDPTRPQNLQALIDTVRDQQLDLGLAFDGDGDRLGVVDGEGNIIWPDRQLILFARALLRHHPGATVIYDIKSSRHVRQAVEAGGGRPLMWKTGHSLMKAKMRDCDALLGGEMSGHLFFRDRWYGFDDGLYAAARLLELLSRDPRPPAAVFADIPDSLATPELSLPMTEGEPARFMRRFLRQARFADARLSTLDGLRVEFADGWGLVRASNTTPCLTLRFEAADPAALARIQAAFRQQMLAVAPDLQLPF